MNQVAIKEAASIRFPMDRFIRNEILLEVESIFLSFGGVHALSDVSFDIRKGEVRSIIGPNGAGKSSMLNVINGFYHPMGEKCVVLKDGVNRSVVGRQ